jgi:hypothetical protein
MYNTNTVARCGNLPGAVQGVSSASEFQFARAELDATGAAYQANVVVSPVPTSKFRMFKVRAGGRVTGGTTVNFTANLDLGKSTTIGSNTTIATTGAVAYNTASGSWWLEATFSVDATALIVSGTFKGASLGGAVAEAALSAAPAANPAAEIAFTVTGQFSGSNAGNLAYLDYLEVEEL